MTKATMLLGFMLSTVGWAGERSVTVCLPRSPKVEDDQTVWLAKGYATRIYRLIGVELRWKSTCSQAEIEAAGTRLAPNLTTVGIEWARTAPAALPPGARAAARPFQPTGTRITVYQDRVAFPMGDRTRAAAVLGHVLAHEIGHVLLGHDGHSQEGLMKPHWSGREQNGMWCKLISFTAVEGEIIRRRLDRRRVGLAAIPEPSRATLPDFSK
ncbi:MAG TPA: hypothetical protein VIM11_20095 [Tepidisphaeraceae bacterium]